jgi:predicted small secreted protein
MFGLNVKEILNLAIGIGLGVALAKVITNYIPKTANS